MSLGKNSFPSLYNVPRLSHSESVYAMGRFSPSWKHFYECFSESIVVLLLWNFQTIPNEAFWRIYISYLFIKQSLLAKLSECNEYSNTGSWILFKFALSKCYMGKMIVRPVIFRRKCSRWHPRICIQDYLFIYVEKKIVVEIPLIYRKGNQRDFDVWF
jgi:hypothetical protein